MKFFFFGTNMLCHKWRCAKGKLTQLLFYCWTWYWNLECRVLNTSVLKAWSVAMRHAMMIPIFGGLLLQCRYGIQSLFMRTFAYSLPNYVPTILEYLSVDGNFRVILRSNSLSISFLFHFHAKWTNRKVLTRHVLFSTHVLSFYLSLISLILNSQYSIFFFHFSSAMTWFFSRNVYYSEKKTLFFWLCNFMTNICHHLIGICSGTMFGHFFHLNSAVNIWQRSKNCQLWNWLCAMRWMYIMNLIKFPHRQSRLKLYILCIMRAICMQI